VPILVKIDQCDRESARRRTQVRLTDWQTQTDFIICAMLYATSYGADKSRPVL